MLQPVSPNSGECLGKRASAFFAVSCFGFGVPVLVSLSLLLGCFVWMQRDRGNIGPSHAWEFLSVGCKLPSCIRGVFGRKTMNRLTASMVHATIPGIVLNSADLRTRGL